MVDSRVIGESLTVETPELFILTRKRLNLKCNDGE